MKPPEPHDPDEYETWLRGGDWKNHNLAKDRGTSPNDCIQENILPCKNPGNCPVHGLVEIEDEEDENTQED